MSRQVVTSPTAIVRVEAALECLREKPRAEPLVVVGATVDAVTDLMRQHVLAEGPIFVWLGLTLSLLAATLA